MDLPPLLTKEYQVPEYLFDRRTVGRTAPPTYEYPPIASVLAPSGPIVMVSTRQEQAAQQAISRTPLGHHPDKMVSFHFERARLPLRVKIAVENDTKSIIETVKNFYGLYEGQGISFQDPNGFTIVPQYANLEDNSDIYVREVQDPEYAAVDRTLTPSGSPRKAQLEEAPVLLPAAPYSRPNSRAMKRENVSPSVLAPRAPSTSRSRSFMRDMEASGAMSDSDAGSVSVSSSKRAKNEQLASAEISLDNIVEGGRRKKAKFESSELPLFAPPQIPMQTSMSSASPQRRMPNSNEASSLPSGACNPFISPYALPSPRSHGFGDVQGLINGKPTMVQPTPQVYGQGPRLRSRAPGHYGPSRLSGGSAPGPLPTPAPTLSGSVMSDEDVALQLMRLGDAANFSNGRTSTSTLDDALSGKAEIASSVEHSEGEEDVFPPHSNGCRKHNDYTGPPPRKRQRGLEEVYSGDSADTSSEEYDDQHDESFHGESDPAGPDAMMDPSDRNGAKGLKPQKQRTKLKIQTKTKSFSTKAKHKLDAGEKMGPPLYPATSNSRKVPNVSTVDSPIQLGPDEEDLSSKPRCQRCRKSKKGCDRQRPCGRCREAGIGIEGCISEDESNGRKGRYGRHMGVPVKKDPDMASPTSDHSMLPISPVQSLEEPTAFDSSKKRKR